MGKYTENLNLYKIDTSLNESGEMVDGNEYFNIDRMLNENWDKIDASLKANRNIGELVWSMDPLVDAGLHLLDGALLEYGAYSAFIDSRATLLLTNPERFTTESDWQEKVSQYGVCGKYVYDSAAKTLRLPKITGFIQGTLDPSALGEIVEAGLPNIKATSYNYTGGTVGTGAITPYISGRSDSWGSVTSNVYGFKFDASTYNPIYKDNFNKVQPQAINGYVYIVVATSTKTDIQINIDNVMTDLNAKADKDLSNINDTAKSFISDMSVPSNKYIDLTLGANGSSYVAPANGWFYISKNTVGNSMYVCMKGERLSLINWVPSQSSAEFYLPVVKDEKCTVTFNSGGTVHVFRFIYAEGAKND